MKTCDNCKLWEPGEGWFCSKERGYCNQPLNGVDQPTQASRGAHGHGEPGDENRLRTGPKFGCINFVPR